MSAVPCVRPDKDAATPQSPLRLLNDLLLPLLGLIKLLFAHSLIRPQPFDDGGVLPQILSIIGRIVWENSQFYGGGVLLNAVSRLLKIEGSLAGLKIAGSGRDHRDRETQADK